MRFWKIGIEQMGIWANGFWANGTRSNGIRVTLAKYVFPLGDLSTKLRKVFITILIVERFQIPVIYFVRNTNVFLKNKNLGGQKELKY